jgi:hypothetical protein
VAVRHRARLLGRHARPRPRLNVCKHSGGLKSSVVCLSFSPLMAPGLDAMEAGGGRDGCYMCASTGSGSNERLLGRHSRESISCVSFVSRKSAASSCERALTAPRQQPCTCTKTAKTPRNFGKCIGKRPKLHEETPENASENRFAAIFRCKLKGKRRPFAMTED